MSLNELTTTDIAWLVAGQIGLLFVMAGGVWTAASNHEDGSPRLGAITIWLIWIQIVIAAFLFTHPFKTETLPSLPPIGHGFRFVIGLGFITYPMSRRWNIAVRMSQRVEQSFTYLVGFVAVVAVSMAGYYGAQHYRSGNPESGWLVAQAKRNAGMLQRDTTLTARMSHQVDSLTRLTHWQAGEVAGLTDEVRGLKDQVKETNGLLGFLLRRMKQQQEMIARLLGKPSLPVQSTGYTPKVDAIIDPKKVPQSLPPVHTKY